MEGRRYATGTTDLDFDLYRVYSPLVRAAARAFGKPTQRHEAGDTYHAVAVADGTVRTGTVPSSPPALRLLAAGDSLTATPGRRLCTPCGVSVSL